MKSRKTRERESNSKKRRIVTHMKGNNVKMNIRRMRQEKGKS